MSLFKQIQTIDEVLLNFIHNTLGHLAFDHYIPFLRNPYFWSPLYLFLLVWMWQHLGKKGLWWCAFFFITFVFCDFISASLLKPLFHRIRPCHEESLSFFIRSIVPCGSGFSFPSSHASNHSGMAIFMITTLRHKYRWILYPVLAWVALVCYAQLYVGVHYPTDILGGVLLGILIGVFFGRYYNRRFGKV